MAGREFFNLYNHDLIRLTVAIPSVRVADPAFNGEQTLALIRRAADRKAALVLFPELGLSAYTCDDLFQQRVVLDGCVAALEKIIEATRHLPIVSVIGLPLEVGNLLFNCAAVISFSAARFFNRTSSAPNEIRILFSCTSSSTYSSRFLRLI